MTLSQRLIKIFERGWRLLLISDRYRYVFATRYFVLLANIVSMLIFTTIGSAQEEAPAPSPYRNSISQDSIQKWLRELGSSEYQVRQNAFMNLWHAEKTDSDAVARASQDRDVTIATSAKWLSMLRQIGGSPEQAAEALTNFSLVRMGDYSTLLRMASNHEWTTILSILDTLDPVQLDLLKEEGAQRQRLLLVHAAMLDRQHSIIPRLMERLYTRTQFLTTMSLWRELGIDENQFYPDALPQNSLEKILVDGMESRYDAAIRLADREHLDSQVRLLRIKDFRWEEYLKEYFPLTIPSNSAPSQLNVNHVITRGLLLDWMGDHSSSKSEFKKLEQFPSQSKLSTEEEPDNAIERQSEGADALAQGWLASGDIPRGLAAWRKVNPHVAFEAHLLRGDIQTAMQIMGIEAMDDDSLDDWTQKKLAVVRRPDEESLGEFQSIARMSGLFYRLGKPSLAQQLDTELIRRTLGLSKENAYPLWRSLIAQWISNSQRQTAIEAIAEAIKRKKSEEMVEAGFDFLYPNWKGDVALVFLATLQRHAPNEPAIAHLQNLEMLWHGKIPIDWSFKKLSLFAEAAQQMVIASRRERLPITYVLAKVAQDCQESTLAIELAMKSQEARFDALVLAGELLAKRGRLEQSEKVFEKVFNARPSRIELALQRSKWLQELGQFDQSQRARDHAIRLPLAAADIELAIATIKMKELDLDIGRSLEFAWRSCQVNNDDFGSLTILLADSLLDSDPMRALQLLRAGQLSSMEILSDGAPLVASEQLQQIEKQYECLLRFAIQQRDVESANRYAAALFDCLPENIDQAIKFVALAQKQLDSAVADQWFRLYFDRLSQHLQIWPGDAMIHNNLAWMLAKLDRELDLAFIHSTTSIKLQPNEATYLDTLAEVEFHRGNIDAAIQTARKCLELEPKSKYYRQQYVRFQAARLKPSTAVP